MVLDFLLQQHKGVEQLFGAGRAAGDVDVNGDVLVHALDDGVIVENSTGRGARPHGDDPFRFGHLFVELLDHGGHLLRDAAGNDHQV